MRYREKVTPTVARNDPKAELAALHQQLKDAETKDGRVGEFIRAGLKEQIALLEAKNKVPKL